VRLLAVDTSTLTGALALLDDEVIVAESRLNVAVTHGERLMGAIDTLLASARWSLAEVDAFAVGIGPGSFTGLRIGISTVKGLAFATGKPVAAVPTLEALAWSLPFAAPPVCPVLDAKKGEVYAALFSTAGGRIARLWPDRAIAPRALAEELAGEARLAGGAVVLVGDGAVPNGAVFGDVLGPRAWLAPPGLRLPAASSLADLGRRALARGEAVDAAVLVPRYIRPSEAELVLRRRLDVSHAR
jgi:tRNA threonylcarbamoyladenosine biosynthesis protein TsaB